MASAMSVMKKMEIDTGVKGILGLALETGVGFGTSFALGQWYHRRSDKWDGKHCKSAAVALALVHGGHANFLGGIADAAGQAGVNALGLDLGLRMARKATGKKAVLISSTAALPAGATEMTSIGALGKAAPGRGLNWDQIEELASGR